MQSNVSYIIISIMKNRLIRKTVLLVLLIGLTPVWARAGGGSNGGGGIVYLILMPFLIVYGAYIRHRLKKKSEECRGLLAKLQRRETGWEIGNIEKIASSVFVDIQSAWTDADEDALSHLSKGPASEKLLNELGELTKKGHRNCMDDISIKKINLLNIQNFLDDELDTFTVSIEAVARDYTVDSSGKIISANTSQKGKFDRPDAVPLGTFTEFWTFEREGDTWVLLELAQYHEWKSVVNRPMLDEGTARESAYARPPGTGLPQLRPGTA